MHDISIAFVTPASESAWKRGLLFSPLARIVIFVLMFMALSFGMGALLHMLGWGGKDAPPNCTHWRSSCCARSRRCLPGWCW
jgi:hypothetical protein